MKKTMKKLVLAKETLRYLDPKELQDVEGAMPPVPVTRQSCTDC